MIVLGRSFVALVLLGALAVAPTEVLAQADGTCAPGQAPRFVFGFADLKAQLAAAMGEPMTCEFADPNGTGDVHQRTTTGLAFWRKSTNTPTFTNGFDHWAHTPNGWVAWTGNAIDPPNAYPPLVIEGFMQGCTAPDASLSGTCQCAINKLQERYAIGEFVQFAQRYLQDGVLPSEVSNLVVECVLEGA
ncbi:MAG TPA: hypothetical protein VGQ62_16605 [Chloroflexota bacterium]|nr:hypothetical protein [Chloroflexota bacterium]